MRIMRYTRYTHIMCYTHYTHYTHYTCMHNAHAHSTLHASRHTQSRGATLMQGRRAHTACMPPRRSLRIHARRRVQIYTHAHICNLAASGYVCTLLRHARNRIPHAFTWAHRLRAQGALVHLCVCAQPRAHNARIMRTRFASGMYS